MRRRRTRPKAVPREAATAQVQPPCRPQRGSCARPLAREGALLRAGRQLLETRYSERMHASPPGSRMPNLIELRGGCEPQRRGLLREVEYYHPQPAPTVCTPQSAHHSLPPPSAPIVCPHSLPHCLHPQSATQSASTVCTHSLPPPSAPTVCHTASTHGLPHIPPPPPAHHSLHPHPASTVCHTVRPHRLHTTACHTVCPHRLHPTACIQQFCTHCLDPLPPPTVFHTVRTHCLHPPPAPPTACTQRPSPLLRPTSCASRSYCIGWNSHSRALEEI